MPWFRFPIFRRIWARTAVERRSRASRLGTTLTLDVRRFNSCWIGHSIRFDVRMRLRCASGKRKYRDCFGELPSYGRFVALTPRLFALFCVLIHSLSGEETGIHSADSTRLAVRANPRTSRNRVFEYLAARGRSTMGWVFGGQTACDDEPQGCVDGDHDHIGRRR